MRRKIRRVDHLIRMIAIIGGALFFIGGCEIILSLHLTLFSCITFFGGALLFIVCFLLDLLLAD